MYNGDFTGDGDDTVIDLRSDRTKLFLLLQLLGDKYFHLVVLLVLACVILIDGQSGQCQTGQ